MEACALRQRKWAIKEYTSAMRETTPEVISPKFASKSMVRFEAFFARLLSDSLMISK